jgi:mannose-6-phosphate isomerase
VTPDPVDDEGTPVDPLLLPANQPPARFYAGGEAISAFRHDPPAAPNTPEDWVGSTTSVRGRAPEGMTRLPDGRLLADAVAADPLGYLGPAHVARFGADTKLLVKLLDAGQRLPVHAHPDAAFAARHVGTAHGKAEAWYILSPGVVHLGLTRDVSADELAALVTGQHTDALLGLLHAIEVEPDDTVYVPPGVLHAIGRGILLAEVQEPEDLSILLEWTGFDLDGETDGHLGLGFDLALQAVERRGRAQDEVLALVRRRVSAGAALVPDAGGYFRLDRVRGRLDLPPGFAIVLAVSGASRLVPESGRAQALPAGSTTLVPFAAGRVRLETDGSVLVARPPAAI